MSHDASLVGKSRDSSDSLAKDESMNIVGAFIRVDSLKVSSVADDMVFIRDTVST